MSGTGVVTGNTKVRQNVPGPQMLRKRYNFSCDKCYKGGHGAVSPFKGIGCDRESTECFLGRWDRKAEKSYGGAEGKEEHRSRGNCICKGPVVGGSWQVVGRSTAGRIITLFIICICDITLKLEDDSEFIMLAQKWDRENSYLAQWCLFSGKEWLFFYCPLEDESWLCVFKMNSARVIQHSV